MPDEANQNLPLSGLRVLELGHIVAGPTASLILADLGADVIKVENPDGGDQARRMPGAGSGYYFFNRNKRSVAIDLKAPLGKALFLSMVRATDVCLDNYAPGALDRLGLGFDALAAENPRLIHMAIKGFLPGPYEHRPSLDELAQMMGGLAFMTGPPGRPMRAGSSIIDIGAATYGVIGILAALYRRAATGKGELITSGLFETTVFWVGQWMARAAATGEPSRPMAEIGQSIRMGWGIFHLFATADGEQVFIGVTSNAHWQRFCASFGLEELYADERLATNAKRVQAQEWMLPRVREAVARYPSAELQRQARGGERALCAAAPAGPVEGRSAFAGRSAPRRADGGRAHGRSAEAALRQHRLRIHPAPAAAQSRRAHARGAVGPRPWRRRDRRPHRRQGGAARRGAIAAPAD